MTQSIVCKNCGTVHTTPTRFCRHCGQRLQFKKLIGTIKWSSWSLATFTWALFSFHLFSIRSCITVGPTEGVPPAAPVTNNGINANATISNVVNSNVNVNIINNSYVAPEAPKKPEEVKDRAFVPKAEDKKRKLATFDIYLFSDEYRWEIGRSDVLENGQTRLAFTTQMQENLNASEEVICIGASSEQIREGLTPEEGRKEEELRAARRAETIAKWVRPYLSNHVIVGKLNIGHHAAGVETASPNDRTSEQRRLIIILVLKKEEGVDIDEALRNAFEREKERHPIYERILTRYSLTRGTRFSWIE